MSDRRTGVCPRLPLLALIVLMAATSLLGEYPLIDLAESLTGSVTGITSYFAARKLTGGKLGLADVWMAGGIGALGGPEFCLMTTAAAIACTLLFAPGKRQKGPQPFLPYLVAACVLCAFFSGF